MDEAKSNCQSRSTRASEGRCIYWRIEGSLVDVSALRQVGFFAWNARSFDERWKRRAGAGLMMLLRPLAYLGGRKFATRLLYLLLRGVTRDRLDLLGEEYFLYVLKPQLREGAVQKLQDALKAGEHVILVGQSLEHIVRPLAQHLGVNSFIANRLEFRDGRATGRLLEPVVRPRGLFAWLASGSVDGRVEQEKMLKQLSWREESDLARAAQATQRQPEATARPVVMFDSVPRVKGFSVRQALTNRHVMLIGVTGFIGKVWLTDLLTHAPAIARITLLIRRNRTTTAQRRFEKIVAESPTFDPLQEIYGKKLGAFLKEKVEVVEG